MILTTGVTSCTVTSTFEGLRSRWMIPFWWGVLHGLTHGEEQLQPLLDGEQLVGRDGRGQGDGIDIEPPATAAPLGSSLLPGALDQDAPHRFRSSREECPRLFQCSPLVPSTSRRQRTLFRRFLSLPTGCGFLAIAVACFATA